MTAGHQLVISKFDSGVGTVPASHACIGVQQGAGGTCVEDEAVGGVTAHPDNLDSLAGEVVSARPMNLVASLVGIKVLNVTGRRTRDTRTWTSGGQPGSWPGAKQGTSGWTEYGPAGGRNTGDQGNGAQLWEMPKGHSGGQRSAKTPEAGTGQTSDPSRG